MWLHTPLSYALCVFFLQLTNGQNGSAPPPGGYYTTRYDHLDIENILNQKRLVHYYSECLLDRGPCTPQGIEFKRILPEALRTNCLRCTEKQRFVTLKTIKRLKKEYPGVWAELSAIWDPTGEYLQQLDNSLKRKTSTIAELQPNPVSISNANIDAVIDISAPKSSQQVPVSVRFEDDNNPNMNNVQNVQISELLPTPKPQTQTVVNTVANKPLSFSSTTLQPVVKFTTSTTTTTKATPIFLSTTVASSMSTASSEMLPNQFITNKPTTKRILTTIFRDRMQTTTSRISYNYDFTVTVKPLHQIPVTGLNMVFKSVNTIIQPITDIAGRVISAGTDIAGIVLNALGVRRTY